MQKANNIFLGLLIGAVLPALAWFVVADRVAGVPYLSKPGVIYLIAMAINLVLLRICYKAGADLTGNGVMIATFAFMLIAFVFKAGVHI